MSAEQDAPVDPEREKSPRRGMCAAVLTLEAIAVALSVPVLITISDVAPALALSLGLGLAVVAVLAAGMLRRESGYLVGHAVEVLGDNGQPLASGNLLRAGDGLLVRAGNGNTTLVRNYAAVRTTGASFPTGSSLSLRAGLRGMCPSSTARVRQEDSR